MNKLTTSAALLLQFTLVSTGLCDQKLLDIERNKKIDTVLAAIKNNNAAKLTSTLPNLSKKEATKLLNKLSEHYKNKSIIVKTDRKFPTLNKGAARTIIHWGTKATSIGIWQNLKSPTDIKRPIRLGLLFAKGSAEPRQILFEDYPTTTVTK